MQPFPVTKEDVESARLYILGYTNPDCPCDTCRHSAVLLAALEEYERAVFGDTVAVQLKEEPASTHVMVPVKIEILQRLREWAILRAQGANFNIDCIRPSLDICRDLSADLEQELKELP